MSEQDNPRLEEQSKENLISLLDKYKDLLEHKNLPRLEKQSQESLISLYDEYKSLLESENLREEQKDTLKIAEGMVTGVLKTKYQLDNQGIEAELQKYRAEKGEKQ